ncbi:hypothetical protein L596_014070 [Steinernema carpocapsae]|uniref:Uncharacterized protein n=1 Tax=Steinernema carpocapsae TaxID=34508 RepID=A0A4U5NBM8_STECR|nr:hypothetical protein L596_014070 [Steinernema carpocapsae]
MTRRFLPVFIFVLLLAINANGQEYDDPNVFPPEGQIIRAKRLAEGPIQASTVAEPRRRIRLVMFSFS